jgi:uncharacterized delta-60 repeat protein
MLSANILRKPAILAIPFICLSFSLVAQDGGLDNTFGVNGKSVTNVAGPDVGTSIALQSTGKIVLGGNTTTNSTEKFALVRYLTNGIVDSSFGTNGRTIATFNNVGFPYLSVIKVQQDDKIIAAGYVSGSTSFLLMRFKKDGIVDSSFGTDGRVITSVGANTFCNALAIQNDGKIVAVGNTECSLVLCRYKTDGKLDSSFGINGMKLINAGTCDKGNSITLQADNKIVIAGNTWNEGVGYFLVVRVETNGKVDSTFGKNGIAITSIRATYSEAFSSAIQSDSKIVIGGTTNYISSKAFGLVRYKPNGILDSSFGTFGKVEFKFPGDNWPKDLTLQADGKIVFAGWINDQGSLEAAMLRYKPNGVLDSSFGTNGQVRTLNLDGNFAYSVTMQKDNKILLGGYTYDASAGNNDFIVMRYNSSNTLPVVLTSFTGVAGKNASELYWSTTSEINSSYFVVERSSGVTEFVSIGNVKAHGNSAQFQQYSWVDLQPLKGDNFYRLKQVDNDGKYTYSKIVHIFFSDEPYLKIYPNPAKNTVTLNGLTAGASITIFNSLGKNISDYSAAGYQYTINIKDLANGIYFIRIKQGAKLTTLKFVKQ